MRIASKILFGKKIVPEPDAVVVAEPISPIIAMPSVLSFSGLCFKSAGVRTKSEIAAVDPYGCELFPFGAIHSGDGQNITAAIAIGGVEPFVDRKSTPM